MYPDQDGDDSSKLGKGSNLIRSRFCRTIAVGASALILALGLFGVGEPAFAQVHAPGWNQVYGRYDTFYMPGPPPGSYLSACIVTTEFDHVGSSASYTRNYTSAYSSCFSSSAQVVFNVSGSLYNGPFQVAPKNQYAFSNSGVFDDGLVGSNWAGCNVYLYCIYWPTSYIH